jgi:hypothetical protein
MTIHICGPIAIRQPNGGFMKKDEVVLGHQHNFHHATFVTHGQLEITLLDVTEVNAEGNPLHATEAEKFIVSANDEKNFALILKGRWHSLRAVVDGTRYQCIYPHRTPQSLTVGRPGQAHEEPFTKIDQNGDMWVRVDKNIVEDAAGWAAAYE